MAKTPTPPLPFRPKPAKPAPLVAPLTFTVDNNDTSSFTVETPWHVIPSMPNEPDPPADPPQESVENRMRRRSPGA